MILLCAHCSSRALRAPLGDFCQNRRESYEITIREKLEFPQIAIER